MFVRMAHIYGGWNTLTSRHIATFALIFLQAWAAKASVAHVRYIHLTTTVIPVTNLFQCANTRCTSDACKELQPLAFPLTSNPPARPRGWFTTGWRETQRGNARGAVSKSRATMALQVCRELHTLLCVSFHHCFQMMNECRQSHWGGAERML